MIKIMLSVARAGIRGEQAPTATGHLAAEDLPRAAHAAFAAAEKAAGPNPNALGFLRRIPGQDEYRALPNGRSDVPREQEIRFFVATLGVVKTSGRW